VTLSSTTPGGLCWLSAVHVAVFRRTQGGISGFHLTTTSYDASIVAPSESPRAPRPSPSAQPPPLSHAWLLRRCKEVSDALHDSWSDVSRARLQHILSFAQEGHRFVRPSSGDERRSQSETGEGAATAVCELLPYSKGLTKDVHGCGRLPRLREGRTQIVKDLYKEE
jgi:hypothetical protein